MDESFTDIAHLDFAPEDTNVNLADLDEYGMPLGAWGDIMREAARSALLDRACVEHGVLHMTLGVRPVLSGRNEHTIGSLYDPASGYTALVNLLSSPGHNSGNHFLDGVQNQDYSDCILLTSSRTLVLSDGSLASIVVETTKSGKSYLWLTSEGLTVKGVELGNPRQFPEDFQRDTSLYRSLRPALALGVFHSLALNSEVPSYLPDSEVVQSLVLDVVDTYLAALSRHPAMDRGPAHITQMLQSLISTTSASVLKDVGILEGSSLLGMSAPEMKEVSSRALSSVKNMPNRDGVFTYLGVPDDMQTGRLSGYSKLLAEYTLPPREELENSIVGVFPDKTEYLTRLLKEYSL